jgi:CTP:molybdopterin cytidylyltransferase MocA
VTSGGSTAGLVLAAGAGRRFGSPKAPFEVDGVRLVDRAVGLLRETGCDPVHVVLGSWLGDVPGATVVVNDGWDEGMGSSLRVGLSSLEPTEADRVLVVLVDLVGLTPQGVARLAAVGSRLAAATYDGNRGHPVVIGREHWAGVAGSAHGDRGARSYLDEHGAELELVEIGDVADGADLDHRPAERS